MSLPKPTEGRATLARSYRNLSEREIRAKLEGPMSDAERVTAKAELLRRNAGDNGPDTTLATGFAPTSTFDAGAVEGEAAPEAVVGGARRTWPVVFALLLAVAGGLAWAIHAKLLRI